jgi:hypothetical protein
MLTYSVFTNKYRLTAAILKNRSKMEKFPPTQNREIGMFEKCQNVKRDTFCPHTISKWYVFAINLYYFSDTYILRKLGKITSFFQHMGGNNELFSRGGVKRNVTDLLYIIIANVTFLPQPLKKARNFHQPPEKSA